MSRVPSPQNRSQWRERLQRFVRSKLTVTEFCRQERVSAASFYRWRKALSDTSSPATSRSTSALASFVPVQVAAATGLEVSFPNGTRLTIPGADQELIKMSIHTIAQARTWQGEE
jgi:hypothetical protein